MFDYQVLRKLVDKEKFKNRSSKDDKPDVQTPITKEEIVSEVNCSFLLTLLTM